MNPAQLQERAFLWSASEATKLANKAAEIAAGVNYDRKVEPEFVGAVLSSLTAIYLQAIKPQQSPPVTR